MDARRGGGSGARVGTRPSPPEKNIFHFVICMVAFVLLVLHVGAFLQRFAPFSPCAGTFCYFFSMCGPFSPYGEPFLGLPPPPHLRKFLLAPMNIDIVLLRTSQRYGGMLPENSFKVVRLEYIFDKFSAFVKCSGDGHALQRNSFIGGAMQCVLEYNFADILPAFPPPPKNPNLQGTKLTP